MVNKYGVKETLKRTQNNNATFLDAKLLGRGYASEVYLVNHDSQIARKVFVGNKFANAFNWIVTGAARIPYNYDDAAIRCAHLRRDILEAVLEYRYDGKVGIAHAYGIGFSHEHKAYFMDTKFEDAEPLKLANCFTEKAGLGKLRQKLDVMKGLTDFFIEIGFCPWQVGHRNPKGMPNVQSRNGGAEVIIDNESGFPNIFPYGFRGAAYYWKRAFRLGSPLYDKVDVDRLEKFVSENRQGIAGRVGERRHELLNMAVSELKKQQGILQNRRRVDRDLLYSLKQGRIDEAQYKHYSEKWARWYARRAAGALADAGAFITRLPYELGKYLWKKIPSALEVFKVLFSGKYRSEKFINLTSGRIDVWKERGIFSKEQSDVLKDQIKLKSISGYMGDFVVQLALNIASKSVRLFAIPPLVVAGAIDAYVGAFLFVWLGSITRTLYTGTRMLANLITNRFTKQKEEMPYVALFGGMPPSLGNFAYIFQILYSKKNIPENIRKFLAIDALTSAAGKIPVIGGEGTLLQHRVNHWAYRLATRGKNNDA